MRCKVISMARQYRSSCGTTTMQRSVVGVPSPPKSPRQPVWQVHAQQQVYTSICVFGSHCCLQRSHALKWAEPEATSTAGRSTRPERRLT